MKTKLDLARLCDDHGIDYAEEGDKHCRPGWLQVNCPLCEGSSGFHLGYNIRFAYFNCWRCGWHSIKEAVAALINIPEEVVWKTIKQYADGELDESISDVTATVQTAAKVTLPYGTGPLKKMHRKYLINRRFDPDYLSSVWGVQGTGHLGSYAFRVIAPIYFQNKLVSYQGRDVTGQSDLRYKACALKDEVIHHKEMLYGIDLVPSESICIVEGITKAWRLGSGAVCTFGIRYLPPQVALMACFSRRYIFFDSDGDAQNQARKLASELSAFRGTTELVSVDGVDDPGDMPQRDAYVLMRRLGIRKSL